jgi:hypothetical protein
MEDKRRSAEIRRIVLCKSDRLLELISQKFDVDDSGCWLWNRALTPKGYARYTFRDGWNQYSKSVPWLVHELVIGEVADDEEVDHLCKVRHCINPDHLEAVTHLENLRRADIFDVAQLHRNKECCPQGHEYNGDNLYVAPNGHRGCKECRRENVRRWRAKNRIESVYA